MTTLMLQELSDSQLDDLDTRVSKANDPGGKENPWDPERKPSQPAIRPWWQRQDRTDDQPTPPPDPLWGRGSRSI